MLWRLGGGRLGRERLGLMGPIEWEFYGLRIDGGRNS